jgi:hypothetical protein
MNCNHKWWSNQKGRYFSFFSLFSLNSQPVCPQILGQIRWSLAQSSYTIFRWFLHYCWTGTDTGCKLAGLYIWVISCHLSQMYFTVLHIQVSAGDEPCKAGAEMSCMARAVMSCMAGAEMSCIAGVEVSRMAGDDC